MYGRGPWAGGRGELWKNRKSLSLLEAELGRDKKGQARITRAMLNFRDWLSERQASEHWLS